MEAKNETKVFIDNEVDIKRNEPSQFIRRRGRKRCMEQQGKMKGNKRTSAGRSGRNNKKA